MNLEYIFGKMSVFFKNITDHSSKHVRQSLKISVSLRKKSNVRAVKI